jgi:hypothetical protein
VTGTMRAARFDAAARALTVVDVPVPEPGPVAAVGALVPGWSPGVALLSSGRLDVPRSVSDVMPLEEVGRGVERLVSKEGDPVRLVVQPWT